MKFARKATTAVGLALTLGLFGLAPVGPVAYAAEDAVVHDGSSSDKAAASCYEAKQVNKDAKSGKYWLYTPSMSGESQREVGCLLAVHPADECTPAVLLRPGD